MKYLKIIFSATLVIATILLSSAQKRGGINGYEDYNYAKDAVKDRNAVANKQLIERSVKWYKRVHRIIDSREKQNKAMTWPKSHFGEIMIQLAQSGEIPVYESDLLKKELKKKDIIALLIDTVYVTIPNNAGGSIDTFVAEPKKPESIQKFRIMEDWVFDYQHSDFRPKIIAIAPIIQAQLGGISLGDVNLFWIKMDDIRRELVHYEYFNAFNEGAMLNYDDFFQMRKFSSYIVKEENIEDLDIAYQEEYKDNPLEALLKSESIKNDIFLIEHDLWVY